MKIDSARWLTTLILLTMAPGCATNQPVHHSQAERAAYLVVNHTDQPVLLSPRLLADKSGQVLYANVQAISNKPARPIQTSVFAINKLAANNLVTNNSWSDPGDENLALPPTVDFSFAPAGDSHRVPDAAVLRWQSLPGFEPIRLPVRAGIPADVLALVQNPWRYRIEIAVWVVASGARLGWQLIDISGESPRRLRRGGYWPVS